MKPLKVLLLVHESLLPSDEPLTNTERDQSPAKTEYDIYQTLRSEGHDVNVVGLYDQIAPLEKAIEEFKPDIAFNLLEEFAGEPTYDQNVVSFLELKGVPYTGCNPRGLMLARDKALTKEILAYNGVPVPKFMVVPFGRASRRPKDLKFPLIVKCLTEEASLGIAQASLVETDERLAERVAFIHDTFEADVIAEEFIPGRELYVGVIGNGRVETLPIWELKFGGGAADEARIATSRVKFNEKYRKDHKITYGPAEDLSDEVVERIEEVCKSTYRALKLSGYARIDLRLTAEGVPYVIEANPNPDIAKDEEFAESAAYKGLEYPKLLSRLLK